MIRATARMIGRIRNETRGTSVVEFGIFAPVLLTMLMGITDVAMGYSRKLQLEQAAYRALERAQASKVLSSYAFLQAEAATAAGVAPTDVVVDTWLECDRVRQTLFAGVCAPTAEKARYIQVRINGSYTPYFAFGVFDADANGNVPIAAAASVRVQ